MLRKSLKANGPCGQMMNMSFTACWIHQASCYDFVLENYHGCVGWEKGGSHDDILDSSVEFSLVHKDCHIGIMFC